MTIWTAANRLAGLLQFELRWFWILGFSVELSLGARSLSCETPESDPEWLLRKYWLSVAGPEVLRALE